MRNFKTMIHEEICTYEVAKLAKEKGFPQQYDSLTHIYGDKDGFNVGIDLKYKKCEGTLFDISEWNPCLNNIAAPTQSLLQRWLREEKKYAISVFWDMLSKAYYYEIVKTIGVLEIQVGEKHNYSNPKGFVTYELTLEDALKYVLKNLI